ncbi:MAG TPA: ABC transporter permease [Chryseosolibacter sp.]|nr:ABC transporter permease [Chryseosolibacter sp.]
MLSHYFTVVLRVFRKSKVYSIINIFGLTLGITCSSIIFLFVYDELTYDNNHSRVNDIYRLHGGWRSVNDNTSQMYASIGYNEGEVLKRDFPQVDEVVRFRRTWETRIEKPGTDEQFLEFIYQAEPHIFNIFSLDLIAGSEQTALADEKSLVVTERTALKYFNTTDVLGKSLRWLGHDTVDFKITGVMRDHPDNTHLKIDLLTRMKLPDDLRAEWFEYRFYTYFTLHNNADLAAVETKIKHFTKKDVEDVEKEIGFVAEHAIMPMNKIHLYSDLPAELETNAKASYVYIFLVVGIFTIVMACINFMNLATARSMMRAKEIGIRKVVGALRKQLVRQFLGEALLMTLLAATFSFVVIYTVLPYVNDFVGKRLTVYQPEFWTILVALVLLVTMLAGFYPAFFLSSFRPIDTLKGPFKFSNSGAVLRKGLVVFQFTVSIALVAGMLIIWNHIQFMRDKDLGFTNKEVLLVTNANPSIKEQVSSFAGVQATTISNRVPGNSVGGRTIIKGWNKSDPQVVIGQLAVDYDYVDLYELEIIAGRNFNKDIPTDEKEAFIVNEAGMRLLGFQNPEEAIGQQLWLEDWGDRKGVVVGVLKDFHFIGVNASIEPFAMFVHSGPNRSLSVKMSGNPQPVIQQIEALYKEQFPGRPFQYSFLDEQFDSQYKGEERFMTIFSLFATLAVVIASLGLYGLATFITEQRTKEVCVRKILGASLNNILSLLTQDFVRLILVAYLIAIPIAYYGMSRWLSAFPYHEEISPLLLIVTGLSVLVLTMLVISYRAIRVALTNPSKTLRLE